MKCPKCNTEVEYLCRYVGEYIDDKYIVGCEVKCPKCFSYYLIREKYKREESEVEW